ncbi:MAG TPA: carboxypeptidase-like regulatory domain-containing protein [Cytophagaceae bacterium]|jgi:hypothetical protein
MKNLTISKPCDERLDNMISNKEGKFCLLCKKNVFDLTKLSNNQISELIAKSPEGLCISTTKSQLEKFNLQNFPLDQVLPLYTLKRRIIQALSVLSLAIIELTQKTVAAQNVIEVTSNFSKDSIFSIEKSPVGDESKVKIKIKVMDDKGQPIPGAIVMLQDRSAGISTDEEGMGSLEIAAYNATVKYTVICEFTGYVTEAQTLDCNEREAIVRLQEDHKLLEDVVITGYGYWPPKENLKIETTSGVLKGLKPKRSLVSRIKAIFNKII